MSDEIKLVKARICALEVELDCGEYGSFAEMLIRDEIKMLEKILKKLAKKLQPKKKSR